jgi:Alpha-lytic protease prodomain
MRKNTSHGRIVKRSLTLLSLAVAALLQTLAANAASTNEPSVPEAMRFALQRDLGVMPGQVQQYLDSEARAARIEREAKAAFGDDFAGTWLERNRAGEFETIVAVTRASQTTRANALGAKTRIARYGLNHLNDALAQLNRVGRDVGKNKSLRSLASGADGRLDPAIHSWHIDLRHNRIVVVTDPGAQAKAIDFVAATTIDPAMVQVRTSPHRFRTTVSTTQGGDPYNMTNGFGCSIGFSAARGNQAGFITAGHCATVGVGAIGYTGAALGTFVNSNFPGSDMAFVQNTSRIWAIYPFVNNWAGGNVFVNGGAEAAIGSAVCRSGRKTGYRCGTITAKNFTANYAQGQTFGLTVTNACSGSGDSGGSIITPSGQAQGVLSGGNGPAGGDNCSQSTVTTVYQPLQPILNAYGLTLQTNTSCGQLNPGAVLPTFQSVVSCDGRFTFVIQGDGNLVLYQNGVGAIWSNQVYGSGHRLVIQTDGNLVVYNSANQARWNTGTFNRPGAFLRVQTDGNVVLYSAQGQPLWTTNTCCR